MPPGVARFVPDILVDVAGGRDFSSMPGAQEKNSFRPVSLEAGGGRGVRPAAGDLLPVNKSSRFSGSGSASLSCGWSEAKRGYAMLGLQ